jgi:hypothetical protein
MEDDIGVRYHPETSCSSGTQAVLDRPNGTKVILTCPPTASFTVVSKNRTGERWAPLYCRRQGSAEAVPGPMLRGCSCRTFVTSALR